MDTQSNNVVVLVLDREGVGRDEILDYYLIKEVMIGKLGRNSKLEQSTNK